MFVNDNKLTCFVLMTVCRVSLVHCRSLVLILVPKFSQDLKLNKSSIITMLWFRALQHCLTFSFFLREDSPGKVHINGNKQGAFDKIVVIVRHPLPCLFDDGTRPSHLVTADVYLHESSKSRSPSDLTSDIVTLLLSVRPSE